MYYFPISKQRITLPFAATDKPYSTANPHWGCDMSPYAGAFGEPITLPWDAQVLTKTYSSATVGCGNSVSFQCSLPFAVVSTTLKGGIVTLNANNLFTMKMCHMQAIDPAVKDGVFLKAGQQVGTIGNTGYSFGAHLHLDIKTNAGDYIDPLPILRQALEQNNKPVEPPKQILRVFIPGIKEQVGEGTLVGDKVYLSKLGELNK